ncbi:MAG: DUF3868 domain-containing protein [Mediterranea sp.]|jgi:hypothetical protein|nr:DUF3868 domain-containing protein [Mediterranea sp.]
MKALKATTQTLIFFFCATSLWAQSSYDGKIWINNSRVLHKGDSVYFDMDIKLTDIAIESERSLTLTPIIEMEGQEKILPSVLINGHRRQQLYERALKLAPRNDSHSYYRVVEAKKNSEPTGPYLRTIPYNIAFPYEDWMHEARIMLLQERCGCGGHAQQLSVGPLLAGIDHGTPIPDTVKVVRIDSVQTVERKSSFSNYDVRLHFPTAQTYIMPDFSDNRTELNRIEEVINRLINTPHLKILSISLQGFASPEGSEAANLRYADGRAQALLYYLQERLNLQPTMLRITSGGEDWNGLEEQIRTSVVIASYRYELENIMRLDANNDRKEALIRQLDGGKAYRLLNEYIFPQLRRVVCRVEYVN